MEAKQAPVMGRKLFLYVTAFFSGMSVMAIELGASRLLAPYFSSSQIVWTVIIGTIMIAMAIGNVWGSIATELKNEGFNIQYVHPEEGTVGWCDYWCIVKDTEHQDLAMKWIDYCTGESFQNAMATAGSQAYCPVNTVVTEQLSDETRQSLWLYPEAPTNVNLALPLTDEQLNQWTTLWDEVKAAN